MIWDDASIAELTRLWAGGMPCTAIAKCLGLTKGQVVGKVWRLELPQRKPSRVRRRKAPTGAMASARTPKRPKPVPDTQIVPKRAQPHPRPVERPSPPPPPPRPSGPVGLLDLTHRDCRWPMNDPPKGGHYLFCGGHAFDSTPYCEYHARLAYRPEGRPRRPEVAAWVPREAAA